MRLVSREERPDDLERIEGYEYLLPGADAQVLIPACAWGYLSCLQDFGNRGLSEFEIGEQAFLKCAEMQETTKYEHLTNDLKRFMAIFVPKYVEIYLCARTRFEQQGTHYLEYQVLQEHGVEFLYDEISSEIRLHLFRQMSKELHTSA